MRRSGPSLNLKLRRYVYSQLRSQPYFGPNIKRLRSYKPETWRYRLGRFRVFFGIDESSRIVNIFALEQRGDAPWQVPRNALSVNLLRREAAGLVDAAASGR